jgi:hypothetical protein
VANAALYLHFYYISNTGVGVEHIINSEQYFTFGLAWWVWA